MIYLNLSIRNPWHRENFKNLWNKTWQISTNKFFEAELIRYSYELITFELDIKFRCDHAGSELTFGVAGYYIHIIFYDNRHWNSESNSYFS